MFHATGVRAHESAIGFTMPAQKVCLSCFTLKCCEVLVISSVRWPVMGTMIPRATAVTHARVLSTLGCVHEQSSMMYLEPAQRATCWKLIILINSPW